MFVLCNYVFNDESLILFSYWKVNYVLINYESMIYVLIVNYVYGLFDIPKYFS